MQKEIKLMAVKTLRKGSHYYDNLNVAVVKLNPGASLKKGDKVQIKGNSTDFTQVVDSLQVEHQDVEQVKAGDSFGLKVDQKVHEGNTVHPAA